MGILNTCDPCKCIGSPDNETFKAAALHILCDILSATSPASDIYRNLSASETGEIIKASPGIVKAVYAFNLNANDRFLKLYNLAVAPDVGVDTPEITIPLMVGRWTKIEVSAEFDLGIGIGCTTGPADADTGAPTPNDVIVNVFYN